MFYPLQECGSRLAAQTVMVFHDGSLCYKVENQAFSRARVLVVRSQTSDGPKYWIAPG